MEGEVVVLTDTHRKILENRKRRAVSVEKVFSLDTLHSSAQILKCCGGQAALVFRAIVGSYWICKPEFRKQGFKIHPTFSKATGLPARQLQRATQNLEEAGYIKRITEPGKKMLITLTDKGVGALAKVKGNFAK